MRKYFLLLFFAFLLGYSPNVFAQHVAVKTNLLYDATASMNLGLEVALNKRWTLDFSGNYNPWQYSDNKKMKHWLVQPELRYWTCEKFYGHFWGVHAHVAGFNMGGIKLIGLEKYRYQGMAYGGGISYGYHWIVNRRFSIEASIGAGYAFLDYGKYGCEKCAEKIKDSNRHYIGPTKIAVSLIYVIR